MRLSEYRQQEMAIAYQQTVLRAWHEIDDALAGYRAQQRRQTHLAEALAANRHAFALARDSYLNGASDFIHVLSTQRAAGSAVRANCFRGGDGDRRGEYLSSAGRRLGTHLPVCGATGEGRCTTR
ncbi:hypothetical protein IC615_05035 [Serratia ureilytica]